MTPTGSASASPTSAELATVRRRLASLLYESMLLLGVLAIGFLVPLIALGISTGVSPAGWLEWLHLFLLLGGYFIWQWSRNGQTLAMQTWQLRIVDRQTGKPPSATRATLRYVLSWPSWILLASGAGLAWTLFVDRDRQFPHDRLARTAIVKLAVRQ